MPTTQNAVSEEINIETNETGGTMFEDMVSLKQRLSALDPSNVVVVADFDLTLANKPARNFHKVKLTEEQRDTIGATAREVAAFIVLTARGEQSTLAGIFGDAGANYSICLASNCGHHVLKDTQDPDGERITIPLASTQAEDALKTTMENINLILESVGVQFGMEPGALKNGKDLEISINGHAILTLDSRERCGALVFEGLTAEERDRVKSEFKRVVEALGPQAENIYYISKDVEVDGKLNGYIDFKPHGMEKGITAVALTSSEHFSGSITADTTFVVAGDSGPDLEMMHALTQKYGAERVINIWVGDDKAAEKFVASHDLPLYNLPGEQYTAIPHMYEMLRAVTARPVANDDKQQPKASAGVVAASAAKPMRPAVFGS